MLINDKREPLLRTLNEIQDRLGCFASTVLENDDPESATLLRSAMEPIKRVIDRLALR
jgi:hypothetical protein